VGLIDEVAAHAIEHYNHSATGHRFASSQGFVGARGAPVAGDHHAFLAGRRKGFRRECSPAAATRPALTAERRNGEARRLQVPWITPCAPMYCQSPAISPPQQTRLRFCHA
jgi:hypothetical protein